MAPVAARARSRFRRFFRMTAVRLSLLYFVMFSIVTGAMLFYIARNSADLILRNVRETVSREVDELETVYQDRGLRALLVTIDQRARAPGASLYVVTDLSGNLVVGNIGDIPAAIFDDPGGPARQMRYRRLDASGREKNEDHIALVKVMTLDEGFRVLVGRDLGEQGKMREIVGRAFRAILIAMVVIGLVTWLFISRRVLKRIDQVSVTGKQILAGDLSGRLPVTGSGDEFDRLAVGVNAMLERIDDLMKGLKEVSDNIAHDLKTPLTRMRNRLDAALTGPEDPARTREALEATIVESDNLIRTFDALLMIARVEAGNQPITMDAVDLAAIARDVAELYEPVVEDAGATLAVEAPGPAMISGNRELLSQAVSNLVDNALKHGAAEGRPLAIRISVAPEAGQAVLAVADNGEGVPEADRGRVLSRFVRLETSRNTPGSGLGLSMVAAIVRHHRGTIALEDAEPGLRIRISLPLAG